MFRLALLNITKNLPRFFITLVVVGIAFSLIFIVEGFNTGLYKQETAYYENAGADLVVMQKGTETLQTSRSVLADGLKNQIEEIRGVASVSGIISDGVMFSKNDNKSPIILVGVHPSSKLGKPWKIARGRQLKDDREIVIDLAFAKRNKIELGERIKILDKEFDVAGLSRETSSYMNPYTFVTKKAAEEVLLRNKTVSFFLVKVSEENDLNRVKDEIERKIKVAKPLTIKQVVKTEGDFVRELMGSPINAILYISYIIGVLVIGLTLYTAVIEKITEYGVMKAIGAKSGQLLTFVLQQSVMSTVFGFGSGILIYAIVSNLIEYLLPQFLIVVNFEAVAKTFVIGVLMAMIAVFFPISKINRLEPATVFKR